MQFPSRATVEHLKEIYPVGTRVELLRMEDSSSPTDWNEGNSKGR